MPEGLFTRLLNALPSQCLICRSWPSQPICARCEARYARLLWRCSTCALPAPEGAMRCADCLRNPPPLDLCYAAVTYEHPWSDLIADFKFREHPGYARELARRMQKVPGVAAALADAKLVLPLPLSAQRLRQRGYNQALLLARALAKNNLACHVLLRVRDTPAQSSQPLAQRLTALHDAFALDPLQAERVRGQRVVLVDDVMTSGATLHAAARALRQGGAAHIVALVLARTH